MFTTVDNMTVVSKSAEQKSNIQAINLDNAGLTKIPFDIAKSVGWDSSAQKVVCSPGYFQVKNTYNEALRIKKIVLSNNKIRFNNCTKMMFVSKTISIGGV